MTAKEAIDILRRGSTFAYDEITAEEFCRAYDMAVDALEKQVPKKPNKINGVYFCTVCGASVEGCKDICFRCGQAVDWEDE